LFCSWFVLGPKCGSLSCCLLIDSIQPTHHSYWISGSLISSVPVVKILWCPCSYNICGLLCDGIAHTIQNQFFNLSHLLKETLNIGIEPLNVYRKGQGTLNQSFCVHWFWRHKELLPFILQQFCDYNIIARIRWWKDQDQIVFHVLDNKSPFKVAWAQYCGIYKVGSCRIHNPLTWKVQSSRSQWWIWACINWWHVSRCKGSSDHSPYLTSACLAFLKHMRADGEYTLFGLGVVKSRVVAAFTYRYVLPLLGRIEDC
jgi:hypothetical protein